MRRATRMKRFHVFSIWFLAWACCLPSTGTLAPQARYSGAEPACPNAPAKAAGGIAADMKLECSRTIGGAAGMTPPSKAQQRLVNLVNAEARYGGHTDTVELFGRATLMEVCDTVGLTSLDTTATGNIFIFTESGEVYALQASGFERVQAGVAGFGQAAGSAAYGP
ncbi:MAG: hypothetical protein GXY44_11395 [Phycisphaerales bacterium]|nr:hypothetical protein [Phycisphaerales bacterium]